MCNSSCEWGTTLLLLIPRGRLRYPLDMINTITADSPEQQIHHLLLAASISGD
jgi:hypothetical protein